jgi:hypothetical protein
VSRFRYAVVCAAVTAALAGCGGHGGSAASSSSANAQDEAVKFAQCMRQHGVNVADPRPGDPGIRITADKKLDQSQIDAAMSDCRKYSPKKDINPNDPKVRDQLLKTAQCLREHGVQIADPQPGQGLRVRVNKGDTKTQQAMEACRKLVPPPGSSPSPQGG